MKVTVIEEMDNYNNFENLEIIIDDVNKFNVYKKTDLDDEQSVDIEDCYTIPELLKKAWEAGKRGESFEIERINNGEEDVDYD